MRSASAFAVAMVLVALGVGATVAGEAPALAGTNGADPGGEVARLGPSESTCQPVDLPPSTAELVVWTAAIGRPWRAPVRVELHGPGATAVRGRALRAAADGSIRVPLERVPPAGRFEACVASAGAIRVSLRGAATAAPEDVPRLLRAGRAAGVVAIAYRRSDDESWLESAGAMAERFSFGKAGPIGPWALWAALAAVAAAWALAFAAFRDGDRRR